MQRSLWEQRDLVCGIMLAQATVWKTDNTGRRGMEAGQWGPVLSSIQPFPHRLTALEAQASAGWTCSPKGRGQGCPPPGFTC